MTAPDLDTLAQVAAGWAGLTVDEQRAVCAELLDLRISSLQSSHGICDAPDCILWDGHAIEGWQHIDDLAQMEQDG